jgi:DNA polymerase-3 subunit delta
VQNKSEKQTSSGFSGKSYREIASDLKAGVIRSIYIVTGDEEYLIDKMQKALIRILIADGCEDADSYVTDRFSKGMTPEEMKELVYTPPFMSDRRLTVIKNSGLFSTNYPENRETVDAFSKVFSNMPDFACLMMIENKIDKRRKALLEAVFSKGELVEVPRQPEDSLCKWVAGILKKDNLRITVEAMNSLVDRVDRNMRTLENEVAKIVLFCRRSGDMEVTIDIVDQICLPDVRGSVFQMTDAIGMRRAGEALEIFDKLVLLREPISKIRFMLSRHIRQLICAKEIGRSDFISSQLKVMPFVARNLVTQSAKFRIDELINIYESCFQSDWNVKTGKMEERVSMEWLLISSGQLRTE